EVVQLSFMVSTKAMRVGDTGVRCRRRWMMVEGGWWLLSFLLGVEPAGRRKSGVGLGDGGVKVDMWAAAISEDDDGECFSPGERNGDGNVKRKHMQRWRWRR
ncbi:hypothetical protein Dimus_033623, partial [Dionaea muscipula]